MQKEIVSFSETDNSDFDNELLNALAQEHSAIQEIEQEKRRKLLTRRNSFCSHIKTKAVEGYTKRSPDPARGFCTDRRRFPQCAGMVGQA